MARYEKGHKETTHKRVVHLASERFRKDGIDGVGVATLMGDAGLTHGGFYAHFASKEALVNEAIEHAFSALPQTFLDDGDPQSRLAAFIDWYLSPAHRDRPGKGCPMAALAPEMARRPKAARAAFTNAASATFDLIVAGLPASLKHQERVRLARAVMSQMLGALQLARVMDSKSASDEFLEMGKSTARALAGLEPSRTTKTQGKTAIARS